MSMNQMFTYIPLLIALMCLVLLILVGDSNYEKISLELEFTRQELEMALSLDPNGDPLCYINMIISASASGQLLSADGIYMTPIDLSNDN